MPVLLWAPVTGAQDADRLQSDFDAAMKAIEEDRLRTARETLGGLLEGNPSLHRARLELARVHYLSRDYAEARRQARIVLDDPDTPPTVRATVLAFLAQIDADEARYAQRHQWTPSVYAGLMYDSNVNVGPTRDVIDIGGVPWTVAPDSREQSDGAFVLNPAIAHTWNPGRRIEPGERVGYFLWQSSLSGYYRAYFDESDYNLGVLTARTGPTWVVPRHWRAGVALQADQIFLDGRSVAGPGGDSNSNALFTSLNPYVTWEFDGVWELSLEGTVTHRGYQDDAEDGRDGWYKGALVSVTRYFNQRKFALQGGAGAFDFEADDDRFSNSGPDLFAGFLWAAWNRGTVYGRVNFRQYDFEAEEPVFGTARDEDEWRYVAGFQHQLAGGLANWAVQGNWIYTDNQSNLDLFDYDRHQVNLGVVGRF